MPPQDEIRIQLPITWQEKSNWACGQRGMKKMPGGVHTFPGPDFNIFHRKYPVLYFQNL